MHIGDNSCVETFCLRNKKYPDVICADGVAIHALKREYAKNSGDTDHNLEPKDMFDIAEGTREGNREAVLKTFEDYGEIAGDAMATAATLIDGLIVIGGDGSFQGARALCEQGIPCIGIPGTIDNDLAYTEMTLGFDTAVNVCVDAVRSIRATSRSHDRPHVVEVMGRHCGDIALMTAASTGAEIVIAPEAKRWTADEIAHRLQSQIDRGNYRSTIVVAEGSWEMMAPFDVYKFLKPYGKEVFEGEPMTAYRFASVLKRKTTMPDGSFPEVRHTVIGYTQRGAQPTARDATFAFESGVLAINLLQHGVSNRVIGMKHGKVYHEDIEKALKARRPFNRSLYNTINGL